MITEILLALILATLMVTLVAGFIVGRKIYKMIINFFPPGVFSPSGGRK